MAGAGEVWLVWGINGWQQIPEAFRPPGTVLTDKKAMKTPMVLKGNAFTTTLRLPPGTKLDHGLWISKTNAGTPLGIWENIESKVVKTNGLIEIESTVNPVTLDQRKAWLSGSAAEIPLVTQEIHYRVEGAGEVWLAWGVEGWNSVPESFRPPGTKLKNRVMHTPLVRKANDFATTVRVPPGTVIEGGFLITKTEDGTDVNVWEYAGEQPSSIVTVDGRIEVDSTSTPVTLDQRKAWLVGQGADLPLIKYDIVYRNPEAAEVWLAWGLDGWQAIPETARPPGTELRDGIMKTLLARDGKLFTATVEVPSGANINYKFVTTKPVVSPTGGKSDSRRLGTFVAQSDGRVEFESGLTKVTIAQRKAWPSGRLADLALVAQEIRYRIAGAEEVWLVWGINGWQAIPEEARPPGTVLKDNKVMYSRMVRKGDTFATTVQVPKETRLDFKFLITKTSRGTPVTLWQDYHGQDFWKFVRANGSLEEKATVTVVTMDQRKAWLAGQTTDLPLVTQEIRYRAPGAAVVWLIWGLEGWQAIPVAARPPGTVLNNGRMQTPLVREGTTFTTTVRLPPGTQLDYGFLITKTEEGTTIDIRQEKDEHGQAFSMVVAFDDWIAVQSTAWLSIRPTDLALVAQEIRYRIAGAEEVWLVWGINGWQAIPEEARPPGTMLKDNKVMYSRMVRKGDTFATTVQVPKETRLDFKFLITKTSRGTPVTLWQDYHGQDFWKFVRANGSLEEKATVTVVTMDQRKAWLAGQTTDLPLVTQEIRYRAPGAAVVWLIWGLEGWQAIPVAARPPGTVLNNGRMQTPLVREGTTFTTTVRLPPGTQLDYGFLITKTEEGTTIDIRQEKDEEGRAFAKVVMFDGRMEVRSQWNRRP